MAGEAFAFQSMGIGRLIKSGRLAVPPNQRAYAWEDRHILNLFHDILLCQNVGTLSGHSRFFLEMPRICPYVLT